MKTKKICEVIKENSINKDYFEISTLEEAFNKNLENYDKIIIGASIRYGRHNPLIYRFIKINKNILEKKKNAFFSVNVVARKLNKNTPNTNPYIKNFLKKTYWKPNKLGVFAGKIDYPNLSFINKHVIRLIMFLTNGPTNTNETYEFTDWESVKRFSNELDVL